jgi:hypothetical protein
VAHLSPRVSQAWWCPSSQLCRSRQNLETLLKSNLCEKGLGWGLRVKLLPKKAKFKSQYCPKKEIKKMKLSEGTPP